MIDAKIRIKIDYEMIEEHKNISFMANADEKKIKRYIEENLIPQIISYSYEIKDSYYDEREQKFLEEVMGISQSEYTQLVHNMER